MTKGILGKKVGMTQVYDESGKVVPVTVIQAGPCHVLQIRTNERDGYEAVQIGFADKPRRLARRSERGHVAKLGSKRSRKRAAAGLEAPPKADSEPKRFVREFRGAPGDLEVGAEVTVGIFRPVLEELPQMLRDLAGKSGVDTEKPGWENQLQRKKPVDYQKTIKQVMAVDVTGLSKGRGYAGVMKRHNFAGQRASHGVKKVHRHAGGTGCSADPSRLVKGRRMAGQYGNARVTIRNLQVVRVDPENHLLLVRGCVPGPVGGYVMVRETNKVG
jgi:large subunit ribosomal protein L3